MTVYVLQCFYDASTEVVEVFATHAAALAEAKRMEKADEVEVGSWLIAPKKVR